MAIEKPAVADVRIIISTGLIDASLQAVIDDAALIAEGTCVESYDAARQKAIVKWLTAHLLASTNDGAAVVSKKLGDASESFSRSTLGDALKGTHYGQQAIALDTNGCLANLGKQRAIMETL